MAIRDFEAYLRECALRYDPNLDINPGAPFDTQVIQPTIRRLGTDPFTVDLATFLADRMQQAYPDLANQEEDAVTDILIKPATLLWDAIVREIIRVRQNLSLADPSILTTDEADSLGANFFATRKRGQYAKVPGRIFFTQPQRADVSPANFFTSRGGLHFFPTEKQTIRTEEMILNLSSDGLYYFDVNLIAEAPGTEFNIGPGELISVANIPSAIRVTNIRKAQFGDTSETAQDFIERAQQETGEKSLVTLRGIAAKVVNGFPEVDRLNVVGFNDPEMQRDVITGGGLGDILVGGILGVAVSDTEGQAFTRRFFTTETNFVTLLGLSGDITDEHYTLTVFDAFGAVVKVRDLAVTGITSANELDVSEQLFIPGSANLRWTLRKAELTLSHIPGGILFPDGPAGTVVIADDSVHVGGMQDTHIRGSGFESDNFIIDTVTDDSPLLSGTALTVTAIGVSNVIKLQDYVLGTNYSVDDDVYLALLAAMHYGYSLQLEGVPPNAGNYRILGVTQVAGSSPELNVTPSPGAIGVSAPRWRIFDAIDVDLLEPKETRIAGTDLQTAQNSSIVTVPAGTDFLALGVSKGDVLRILTGTSAGDYAVITAPPSPTSLQVDRKLLVTASNLSYSVFRPNVDNGLRPPFIRITSLELLDSSGQPLGTTIPYALPVDAQSRAFQNPARGVKHDLRDVSLGLVGASAGPLPTSTYFVGIGWGLDIYIHGIGLISVALTVANPTVSVLIADLNALILAATLGVHAQMVVPVGTDRFGFRPVGTDGFVAVVGGTAMAALFGNLQIRTTGDIRSADVLTAIPGGWTGILPAIDMLTGLDVVQVQDGYNVGFYAGPFTTGYYWVPPAYPPVLVSDALLIGTLDSAIGSATYVPVATFAPEVNRHVEIGSRSLGSARLYFLEPTSIEVDSNTRFELVTSSGTIRFLPDPTLEYQRIPAAPTNKVPQDGWCQAGLNTFNSVSQDFLASGIALGDKLLIETMPLEGTQVLVDPVPLLANTTLVFSLDDSVDRTLIFIRNDISLPVTDVGRQNVVDQINAFAGEDIVELTAANTLRFTTAKPLIIRASGTSNSILLGLVANTGGVNDFTLADQTNESPFAAVEEYVVTGVGTTTLLVDPVFPSSAPYPVVVNEQSFRVMREGVQRCSTGQMALNVAEVGLYYFDVELVSEGTGDLWNIAANLQFTVSTYRSDGYYLTTDDENLTFSPVEKPRLVLSRSVLASGVDDDPVNATQLTSTNIQITYDRLSLVSDVQNFLTAETERVVCANPLARHLIPHFVRMTVEYTGGSTEDVVLADIEDYIHNLFPIDTLDASDVQKLVTDRGASYVKNPLDLLAIVHNLDRSIWAQRSQNQLSTSRLSSFVADVVTVSRNMSGAKI